MNATRPYRNWIGGDWQRGAGGVIARHSPAHGGLLATFQASGAADVDAAVRAARHAFDAGGGWPTVPSSRRAAVLGA